MWNRRPELQEMDIQTLGNWISGLFDAYSYLIQDEKPHQTAPKSCCTLKPTDSPARKALEAGNLNVTRQCFPRIWSDRSELVPGIQPGNKKASWELYDRSRLGGCATALVNKDKVDEAFEGAVGKRYEEVVGHA